MSRVTAARARSILSDDVARATARQALEMIRLGGALSVADVVAVARGAAPVGIGPEVVRRLERGRATLERLDRAGEAVYGVNTGVGKLKDTPIPPDARRALQRNLVLSHAAGVGEPLGPAETRAVLLLLAASLARGHSGVRPVVVERLVTCLTHGILPVVPCRGSVGASGDLAPLAHVASCLIGEGEVMVGAVRRTAREALRAAGLAPLVLEMKEGLALLNGTHVMAALATLLLHDATGLLKLADVSGAMSLEALMGSHVAFDARIHALRPHPGQVESAANLWALTEESGIIASHRDCGRVQDAYSLRCMPQVHGAAREGARLAREIVERELGSVTDNPLVFPDDDAVLSGGNFHGQPLALALDVLAIGLTQLAGIAERRIDRLVNPLTNEGLPPFLAAAGGLHSGYMIAQYTAAALVAECRALAHPASVDSIPTSGLQEDWNSMGATAALKSRQILGLAEQVLGIELVLAAQALDFRRPLEPGLGTRAALAAVRARVARLEEDRPVHGDLAAGRELVRDGSVLAAAETASGPLR